MATKQNPLLCELHSHTTWSDGALSVRELCDLYGRNGFDVLAITDHTSLRAYVQANQFAAYLAEIEEEAERARRQYGLLVLPGLELTFDAPEPEAAGHAVAVGLRTFVGMGAGLEEALRAARAHGAALIAAHPYSLEEAEQGTRPTAAFAVDPSAGHRLSTASNSSTGTPSSPGLRRRAFRRSRRETSTCRRTSRRGRRCFRVQRTSTPSSTTFGPTGPRTSCSSGRAPTSCAELRDARSLRLRRQQRAFSDGRTAVPS
jgi:hypothetical protein